MSPNPLIVGAHMSIAKGFMEAAQKTIDEFEANALQLFLKSPRGRGTTKLTPDVAEQFCEVTAAVPHFAAVAHASYLLNLAKPLDGDRWPLQSLVDDLRSMDSLNGAGVVLHIGKTLKLDYEEAEDHLVTNLNRVLEMTQDIDQPILLENTAGQGTEMGTHFEQLASLFDKLKRPKRIKFCLDTCHAFAAGYDLRTPQDVASMFKAFNDLIGIEHLAVIHFNDSKRELDARRDRHENLDQGHIGKAGLTAIAEWAQSHGVPLILETPEKERTHLDDLNLLRSWL